MHKSYQPLKPVTNKYLQKKWDQTHYEDHRSKVRAAKPVVNTRGIQTPAHIKVNLKKLQLEEERRAVIERDNQRLANRLTAITQSKGLVDHRNHYTIYSLNGERRRAELLRVTHENQAIYQRITESKSEYRKELWEEDWEKVKQRRDDIARYPRGVTNKQKPNKCVMFSSGSSGGSESSSAAVDDDDDDDDDDEDYDENYKH